MRSYLSEPYRIFFPVGLAFGIWGVALWLLFSMLQMPYPGVLHSYIMIGGFLTAFTSGFLMTAVPRFTGTFFAEPYELGISLLSLFGLVLMGWTSEELGSFFVLIGHGNLIVFFLRRFFYRRAPLPLPFLFIPVSLSFSVIGYGLIVGVKLGWLDGQYYVLARLLTMHAFMLGLVLGVGSKIIPAFTGYGFLASSKPAGVLVSLFAFFFSFLLQFWLLDRFAFGLRFSAVLYIAIAFWKIYQKPLNPSKLSYGIWISCWGILVGLAGATVFPKQFVAWNHILFIAGFALMTLMIGSRVVISHGGFDLIKEGSRSWAYHLIALFLVMSTLRVLLNIWTSQFLLLLILSSAIWIFCLFYWWLQVGIKVRGRPH